MKMSSTRIELSMERSCVLCRHLPGQVIVCPLTLEWVWSEVKVFLVYMLHNKNKKIHSLDEHYIIFSSI